MADIDDRTYRKLPLALQIFVSFCDGTAAQTVSEAMGDRMRAYRAKKHREKQARYLARSKRPKYA